MSHRSRVLAILGSSMALLACVGCPHRSPQWSPDGKRLLVLAGARGESVDHAASRLYLVDLASGRSERIEPPEEGARYLAATWIDSDRFLALTGRWDDDFIEEGTGKVWARRASAEGWKALDVPAPNEERATRRLPVVLRHEGKQAVAYPTGSEAVSIVSLEGGGPIEELEPAELVGPGPAGGLVITRPLAETGDSELVLLDASLEPRWKVPFAELRAAAARRLDRKPVEVAFNDTSTSHLPRGGEKGWVGVNLTFSDVGWREGITGYYVRLREQDGSLLSVQHAIALSGRPAAASGRVWGVLAPDPKEQAPVTLRAFDLESGAGKQEVPLPALKKEEVHGYSLDPAGERLALSLNLETPVVVLYPLDDIEKPRRIRLE